MSDLFIDGIEANASSHELSEKIKDVFLKASDNLSWLSPGDTVLLKPALNSFYPYPATTHPQSILTIAEILDQKGANVFVGDQSGIEHVLVDKFGSHKKSSKWCFKKSGMGKENNLKFTGFEEEGWKDGYFNYKNPSSTWKNGFYVTKWIQKADHIINLPRLSTHALAGVSLGFKNMVGLLRDDSRMNFHLNGTLVPVIKRFAKGAEFDLSHDHSNTFFEKITDISLAIKDKLRVTLFTGTQAQVTFGPDKYAIPIKKTGMFSAHIATPDTGLIFAGSDPVAAEVLAIAFLSILYSETPILKKQIWKTFLLSNRSMKNLSKSDVWDNPFIRRALQTGLGNGLINPHYTAIPNKLKNQLNDLIQRKK